jgi:hypothetical protein
MLPNEPVEKVLLIRENDVLGGHLNLPNNFRVLLVFERINGMDTVFLQEQYSIYQLRGMITI